MTFLLQVAVVLLLGLSQKILLILENIEQSYQLTIFLTGYKESLHNKIKNYQGDCSNKSLIEKVFKTHNIKTVLHFAAQSSGEISFDDPERFKNEYTLNTSSVR